MSAICGNRCIASKSFRMLAILKFSKEFSLKCGIETTNEKRHAEPKVCFLYFVDQQEADSPTQIRNVRRALAFLGQRCGGWLHSVGFTLRDCFHRIRKRYAQSSNVR